MPIKTDHPPQIPLGENLRRLSDEGTRNDVLGFIQILDKIQFSRLVDGVYIIEFDYFEAISSLQDLFIYSFIAHVQINAKRMVYRYHQSVDPAPHLVIMYTDKRE